ncbi:MAG: cyclic nucleotide-binding domain-containing protein [Pseudanabaenaceae cyanobacterium bins.68]|nr:cyclic nucleotide-binding domain-containing protein [Pseudanabaenaceae cyanobacterium bins.68]
MEVSHTRLHLINQIAKIPFFQECSQEKLLALVNLGYRRHAEPGEFICLEGDVGNSFSLILKGRVEVILMAKRQVLGKLSVGDFFGEIALLTGTRRTASVRAIEPSQLFVVHRSHLRALIMEHPILAEQIATKLSERELALIELGVLEKLDGEAAINLVKHRIKTAFGL